MITIGCRLLYLWSNKWKLITLKQYSDNTKLYPFSQAFLIPWSVGKRTDNSLIWRHHNELSSCWTVTLKSWNLSFKIRDLINALPRTWQERGKRNLQPEFKFWVSFRLYFRGFYSHVWHYCLKNSLRKVTIELAVNLFCATNSALIRAAILDSK